MEKFKIQQFTVIIQRIKTIFTDQVPAVQVLKRGYTKLPSTYLTACHIESEI
jgi:hypothetical protein